MRSRSSQHLWLQLADFVVRTGRMLVYPIYQGTYQRRVAGPRGPNTRRDVMIQRGKDLRRAVNYLETQPDVDRSRIAFYGPSLGAQLGPLFLAIEPRLHADVEAVPSPLPIPGRPGAAVCTPCPDPTSIVPAVGRSVPRAPGHRRGRRPCGRQTLARHLLPSRFRCIGPGVKGRGFDTVLHPRLE